MRLRRFAASLVVSTALAGGACAPAATPGASPEAPASENTVTVQVSNTLTPPSPLTIYILPLTGGARRLLGTVSPNRTESFRYEMMLSSGNFRLMGRATGGGEVASTPISLSGGETVRWDVQLNAIRVTQGS